MINQSIPRNLRCHRKVTGLTSTYAIKANIATQVHDPTSALSVVYSIKLCMIMFISYLRQIPVEILNIEIGLSVSAAANKLSVRMECLSACVGRIKDTSFPIQLLMWAVPCSSQQHIISNTLQEVIVSDSLKVKMIQPSSLSSFYQTFDFLKYYLFLENPRKRRPPWNIERLYRPPCNTEKLYNVQLLE